MTKKEFIAKVISENGETFQKKKALEELSELSTEIIRDLEFEGDRKKIIEELSDVYLMLEQLKAIYDITDLCVEAVIQYKIDRYLFITKSKDEPKETAQKAYDKVTASKDAKKKEAIWDWAMDYSDPNKTVKVDPVFRPDGGCYINTSVGTKKED